MAADPGGVAVLTFFVISGLVIVEAAYVFYPTRPGAFLLNRILRIFPAYIATVAMTFVLLLALAPIAVTVTADGHPAHPGVFSLSNLISNILVIVPMPGRFAATPHYSFLQIGWALLVELAFYVFVGLSLLVVLVLQRIPALSGWGVDELNRKALFLSALVFLGVYAIHRSGVPVPMPFTVAYAPFFVAGGAFVFAVRGHSLAKILFAVAMIASFCQVYLDASASAVRGPIETPLGSYVVSPALVSGFFALLIAATLVCAVLPLKGVRKYRDMKLGDLSYPLYIGHWLPILVFINLRESGLVTANFLTLTVVALVALAFPLAIERTLEPLVRSLRNRVRDRAVR
jgi:peptidoglycan/LPS O-acetylase OafA/YrhL